MKDKLYWSKLSTDDMARIPLTYEDLFKLLDCYYGNIFITDGEGYILYLNRWKWTPIGMSRNDYLGKHVTQLVEDGVFKYSVTMEVLKTKQVVVMEGIDVINNKKFLTHAIPVFDDEGNILFTVHYNQYGSELTDFLSDIENSKVVIDHMSKLIKHYSKNLRPGMQIIYRSKTMEQVLHYARKVAKTDGSVLVEGESGTGKELLAHYIFDESSRKNEVFLPINCAAIPRELMESELFGYVPGAFTGANKEGKVGLFELADKGTIFLDEVGEIPLHVQSKLLRVLESGEIIRVGSAITKQVDVRIIAATNRDLQTMVQEGTFRSDLYYRINVLPLTLPPLRERPEDILPLADYCLQEFNGKYHVLKKFSDECMETFLHYKWPGNVRELKNMIHRMVITTDRDILDAPNLDMSLQIGAAAPPQGELVLGQDLRTAMQKFEKEYIEQTITAAEGNVTKAAKMLGVHRTYIYRKLKKPLENPS